jgi:predicted component of type VI protein secretion system
LLAAFTSSTEADHAYILEVFLDLIRNRLEALPETVWKDYKVFLTIAKRTLEAAYVNFMGDLEAPRSA